LLFNCASDLILIFRSYLICLVVYRLPEIPKDTLESNPIMRTDELPQFSKISSAKIVTGISKLCMEFERDFEKFWLSLAGMYMEYGNLLHIYHVDNTHTLNI